MVEVKVQFHFHHDCATPPLSTVHTVVQSPGGLGAGKDNYVCHHDAAHVLLCYIARPVCRLQPETALPSGSAHHQCHKVMVKFKAHFKFHHNCAPPPMGTVHTVVQSHGLPWAGKDTIMRHHHVADVLLCYLARTVCIPQPGTAQLSRSPHH